MDPALSVYRPHNAGKQSCRYAKTVRHAAREWQQLLACLKPAPAGRQDKYLCQLSGAITVKLCEIVNLEMQQRNVLLMRQNAKRQVKQSKAAQSRLKIQKARAKVQQAQQQLAIAIRAAHQAL